MQDMEGSASTTFFSHSSLHALSCVFRLVYFACTHVLSFSHLCHIRSLMLEKSYESTIHSLSLAIQLSLEKAKRRTGKEENKARRYCANPHLLHVVFSQNNITKNVKTNTGSPHPTPRSLRKPCRNAPSRTVTKQYYIRRSRQNDASTTKQYNTALHLTLQTKNGGRQRNNTLLQFNITKNVNKKRRGGGRQHNITSRHCN